MNYRKDIQMLRGVAVLLVVLFHFGIDGFDSGFLGVDIFLVISGYLMATLYDPLRTAEFFVKRTKRLLPAYFAIVVLTLLIAVFITTPNDYGQVSRQALFASAFASNIGFWMENSYFDKAAFKPLLHLWSLGLEIQFYMLIPLIYWVFRRTKHGYLLTMAASGALCFVVVGISPKTSFFWLPFRLWEFLIGFGVARYVYNGPQRGLPAWVGFASLVAIAWIPFISVDGLALGFMKGHPGIAALLICLATATTLSFGIPSRIAENPVSGLLEKIGGYSYSIYLAHFPVMALFLYQPFSGTVLKTTGVGQAAALLLSVALASGLLFVFVEQPGRKKVQAPLRWILTSFLVVLAISQFGLLVQQARTPPREMLVYQAWDDRSEYRCGKIDRVIHPGAISCEITSVIKAPYLRVLLVGNSHADAIKETFKAAAQARNVAVFFMVENNPLMSGGVTPQALIKEARSRQAAAIVLHFSPGSVDATVVNQLARLSKEEQIRLSFVLPVPVWNRNIPMALLNNARGSEALPSQNIYDYLSENRHFFNGLATIEYPLFKVYQTADVFCREGGDARACRVISESGRPLYFDSQHLTLTGSELLREIFDQVISDLL